MAQISAGTLPFLKAVISRLKDLIDNDAPCLKTERKTKVDKLNQLMDDPQINISEKQIWDIMLRV